MKENSRGLSRAVPHGSGNTWAPFLVLNEITDRRRASSEAIGIGRQSLTARFFFH